ncbi:tyrosine-protein phosphatase non-receptor type 9-like [Solea senegalensis]|uniref:Tyrosine-protein phosphatase non-receptor type 9 n=2 Tax=Solea senegalensis TaxID=28829 RepID=A0AAV6QC48_SOLSE|nr:tyrosine-protein phosphatase non-receptor type 9 [Solea senegalensis]KAG7487213.1 tyrosine-protein phosphatase non-receptor type 9-like [Solea senegalensis]
MAEALTTQEQLAVEEFLSEVRSREQPHSAGLVSQPTAVKFLMARKFDVSRAIDLFQAYKNTRIKEGIININPDEEPLRSELLSGKFTVLPGRDAKGAALALFTARLHRSDVTTHKAVLQAIIYQLDKAIESLQTQRDGLIFIYDMTNSSYGNFDYELCVKILNLLKGAFPARLKCVFIVSSPLWFRAPFAVLRLFVREKLRERVCTVKAHELANHIPVSSLPEHLGGTSQYSHVAWIQSCVNVQTNTVQGDTQEHDTHDCVGSLLRSYSLECSNTSAGATLSHAHINTQLGSELAVANSNCYDDNNANPRNHCTVVDGRTRGLGQYQQSPHSAANRQGNHQHWNGAAVSEANMAVSGSSVNANMNGRGRQAPPQSDTPPDTPLSQKGDGDVADCKATDSAWRSQSESVKEEDEEEVEDEEEEGVPPLPQKSLPRPPHQPSSQSPPLSSSCGHDDEDRYMEVSVHMPEQGGMTVHDLVEYVKRKKKKGIYQEYEEIRKEPPTGTFDYSKKLSNQIKNRYSDVLCLDQSRVRLCQLSDDEDETSDYINASFMDGYKRGNAYIATQGPLPKTFGDFWRMVWEQMVLIIVMTTRVVERGRVKCGQYWPLEEGRTEQYGYFLVRNTNIQVFQDFKLSLLELYNTQSGERREVCHYLYVSWPDFGVPKSASAMLDFREHVLKRRDAAVQSLGSSWIGPLGGPPVVVHCSAGIGRTGTFCTLDICLSRLEDIGTVDVHQTVRRMRTQRAFSIQTWDQYYFCYTAVIEYAQRHGKLSPVQWSDSDLETDSE